MTEQQGEMRGVGSQTIDGKLRGDWGQKERFDDPIFQQVRQDFSGLLSLNAWPELDQYRALFDYSGVHADLPQFIVQKKMGQRAKAALNRRIRSGDLSSASQRYEHLVARQGLIPVQTSSWHDFFNIYSWWKYPLTKCSVFERACREVELYESLYPRQIFSTRTRAHDRLTAFEEGSIVLFVEPRYVGEVAEFVMSTRVHEPELMQRAVRAVVVYGHAIYEELLLRRQTGLAMAVVLPYIEGHDDFDCEMAKHIPAFADFSLQGAGSIEISSVVAWWRNKL